MDDRRVSHEPAEHPYRRWSDRTLRARFKIRLRENWYRDVWLFVITGIVLYVILATHQNSIDAHNLAISNRQILMRFDEDARARRNESCRYFELQESISVKRITSTYAYLDHLPRSEWKTPLTKTIVQALPGNYQEAQANRAPSYCDEQGVGLPEPGPKLPTQRSFAFMLR